KLAGRRHQGPLHQHGDHPNAALQGRPHLHAHEIFRVVQPAPAFLVGRTQPAFADHGHQHIARAHALFDRFYEVDPRLDAIDVHEDFIFGKAAVEVVVQAPGRVGGVLATVADEDLPAHSLALVHCASKITKKPQSSYTPFGALSASL